MRQVLLPDPGLGEENIPLPVSPLANSCPQIMPGFSDC